MRQKDNQTNMQIYQQSHKQSNKSRENRSERLQPWFLDYMVAHLGLRTLNYKEICKIIAEISSAWEKAELYD